MSKLWPFTQWGLNLIRPLPLSKGSHKYVVVAVNYFTKWIKAEPLSKITEKNIWNFV